MTPADVIREVAPLLTRTPGRCEVCGARGDGSPCGPCLAGLGLADLRAEVQEMLSVADLAKVLGSDS